MSAKRDRLDRRMAAIDRLSADADAPAELPNDDRQG